MLLAAFETSEDVGRRLSRLRPFGFHHALAQRVGKIAQSFFRDLPGMRGSGRFAGLAQPLSVRTADETQDGKADPPGYG